MNKRKESPQITPDLLKLYDKETLDIIKTTFYLRKRVGCKMSYKQYVKCLHSMGFISGMRIIRLDKKRPWSADNMKVYDDSAHKKMKDIDAFYRENGNKLPKKVIIKMREVV